MKLWGRGEIHTKFWSGNLNENYCVENLDRSHFCKKEWKVCFTVELYPFLDCIYGHAIKHNVLEYNCVSFFRY